MGSSLAAENRICVCRSHALVCEGLTTGCHAMWPSTGGARVAGRVATDIIQRREICPQRSRSASGSAQDATADPKVDANAWDDPARPARGAENAKGVCAGGADPPAGPGLLIIVLVFFAGLIRAGGRQAGASIFLA
jgi:hypothetical protein